MIFRGVYERQGASHLQSTMWHLFW